MALQRRLDQVLSERAQRGERTGFVRTDEVRIANHIRSQNCRQSPLRWPPQYKTILVALMLLHDVDYAQRR